MSGAREAVSRATDRPGPPASRLRCGPGRALVLAILYWHLSFSRIGMEPILVPFFATLAFAALVRGLNTGRWFAFVLAGLALGGSLYTYKAGYFVPILAVLFVAYAAAVERGFLRPPRPGPARGRGWWHCWSPPPSPSTFATHPANFLQRPASVALVAASALGQASGRPWREPAAASWACSLSRAMPIRAATCPAGRPSIPSWPCCSWLGLGWSLLRFGAARAPFCRCSGSAVMALPTLLTEHAPHFGRAIGATPALALLCALGGWTVWRDGGSGLGQRGIAAWPSALRCSGRGADLLRRLDGAGLLSRPGADSPDLFYAYDVGLVRGRRATSTACRLTRTRLPDAHARRALYACSTWSIAPCASFDGRAGLVLPAAGPRRDRRRPRPARTTRRCLPCRAARPDGERCLDLGRSPMAGPTPRPTTCPPRRDGRRRRSRSTPVDPPISPAQASACWATTLDAAPIATGRDRDLTLYWQALAPLDADYTVFAHLLGEYNPATGGPVWAGHDGQPDGGHYPTTAWQPGEIILDVHPLAAARRHVRRAATSSEAGPLPAGDPGRACPLTDSRRAQPLPDDAALLGDPVESGLEFGGAKP